jgi:tRNA(adenine34) deaminase
MKEFYTSWMKEALLLAQKAASEDEVPVGAIVLHNQKIIGKGYNQREQLQSPVAHAEILALQDASRALGSWRLTNCILVVTLEPCPMCLAALQQSRIQEVVFGATDLKGGALSLGYRLNEDLRTNHRFSVQFHETLECSKILKEFFLKKRQPQV